MDSPGYLSLVTITPTVGHQHFSIAAAYRSPASDRLCGKCGSMVSSSVPYLQVTFPVFLTSVPMSPRAPHSEE